MRRDREIAFFEPYLVAEIRVFDAARIPVGFPGIDKVVARVFRLVETDTIKYEKLRFRPEIRPCRLYLYP